MTQRGYRIGLLTAICAAGLAVAAAPDAAENKVRIGMLKSMLREVPPSLFNAMAVPFQTVVQTQTGLKGTLTVVDTPEQMQAMLMDGSLQLGVFHGFEFAWMKLKEQKLEPLMLVSVNPNMLQAVVVVENKSTAKGVGDCRGQKLVIPTPAREHSRLFLSRRCRTCGASVQEFFPKTVEPTSFEDALDAVVDGTSQVAIVDNAALQMFQRRKPGRFARLKMLESSEPFPPSVIAYGRDKLDVVTQTKFKEGMSTAHTSPLGSHLMGLMKITGFAPVPVNFDQSLAVTLKAYPPPG